MPILSWGVGIWVWEESRPMGSQGWAVGWRWSGEAPKLVKLANLYDDACLVPPVGMWTFLVLKDPLGVSPSKGNQGTTRGKEKILLTWVGIQPTSSGLDHSYAPLLSLRRDSPPKSSPTFSVRPCSSVGRVMVDLILRLLVRFPGRSKEFFLYLVWFPDSLY